MQSLDNDPAVREDTGVPGAKTSGAADDLSAQAEGQDVFIGWSGAHCQKLAQGLKQLLSQVFGPECRVWLSRDLPPGAVWREQIRLAANMSQVAVICLTPESLGSHWIYYEAGAFLMHGKETLPLTCLVPPLRFQRSPFKDLQVGQASQSTAVRSVVDKLAAVLVRAGRAPNSASDERQRSQRFEAAWNQFETIVAECERALIREARQKWLRPGVAVATILVSALAAWYFQCALSLSRASRCDCEWKEYVRGAAQARDPFLPNKVKRRPFVLANVDGRSVVLGPLADFDLGGKTFKAEVIYAASEKDQRYPSKLAITGAAAGVVGVREKWPVSASHQLEVLLFDTLSDDQFCEKAERLAKALDGKGTRATPRAPEDQRRAAGQVGDFISQLLGEYDFPMPHDLRPQVQRWVEGCLGIQ